MRFTTLAILLSIFAAAFAAAVAPGELYRWEDADGRVHFSDRPPTGSVSHLDVQPLQPPAEQADRDDYYSIENQAKRLQEERTRHDRAREEADRERLEEQERRAAIEEARLDAERRAEEDRRACCPIYLFPPPPFYGPVRPVRPQMRPPMRPMPPLGRPASSPESQIRGGLLR